MHRADVGRAAVRRRLNGAILLSHVRQVCSVLNTCVTKAGSAKNIPIRYGIANSWGSIRDYLQYERARLLADLNAVPVVSPHDSVAHVAAAGQNTFN